MLLLLYFYNNYVIPGIYMFLKKYNTINEGKIKIENQLLINTNV